MKKVANTKAREENDARQCKPCAACCGGWLRLSVYGVAIYPGRPCPRCTGRGCGDYENRPKEPCATFSCAWLREPSFLPKWMKPNVAKVIVMLDKLVWRDKPVIYAVPVGRKIPDRSLNWLKDYARKNGIPLVYCQQVEGSQELQVQQMHFAQGPREFELDFMQWLKSQPAQ